MTKSLKTRALFFLLVLLHSVPVLALTPENEQRVLAGLDSMYALDLESATAYFQAVDVSEPRNPSGPLFLAGLYWIQYAQTFDVLEGGGILQKKFLAHTEEAIKRGETLLKSNPRDAEALMWLGAAWGYRGRWKVLERSWVGAARLGLKGYRYLQRAVKADPQLYDAYLGLGIYEYYADTMPAVIRVLKALVIRGNKKQGLAYIQTTLEKGKFSRTEAKIFLMSIYSGQEGKFEEALALARELRAERPGNLYFGLLKTSFLMHLKRWDEAAREADKLLVDIKHRQLQALEPTIFYLYAGEAYQGFGDQARAIDYFTWGMAAASDHRKATVTYLLLRRGQSLDLLGRREEALTHYREVSQRRDYFDSASKAQAAMKMPITREELDKQLGE